MRRGDRRRRSDRNRFDKDRVGEKLLEVTRYADRRNDLRLPVSEMNVGRTERGWLKNLITRVGGIINKIAAVAQLLEYGIRLFSEVDLKTNMVDNIELLMRQTRDTPENRNDRDKVDKGSSIFLVIDYTGLALLISAEVLL